MSREPPAVTVAVHDQTAAGLDDPDRWRTIAERTLRDEGVTGGQLDLIFVDEAAMAGLNEEHLGATGPTDVLAFPLDGPDGPLAGPVPAMLGDVVVCPVVADRQATAHGVEPEVELTLLVIHGVLHVLGHDHAEPAEAATMQARERHHLGRYGHDHPLIPC